MERFAELGCYIAYGGAATFKRNDDVREAFAATPLDRILFETDCPYMAPEPIRGLECEPAMISITANALVNDRVDRTGEDAETIAQAAWENACKLFSKIVLAFVVALRYSNSCTRAWRNWQTRTVQVRMGATP